MAETTTEQLASDAADRAPVRVERRLVEIAEQLRQSVVSIHVFRELSEETLKSPDVQPGGRLEGLTKPLSGASGFFISPNRIMTNLHVVDVGGMSRFPYRFEVRLASGEVVQAKVIWPSVAKEAQTFANLDVAILEIEGANGVPVTLGDSDAVKVGEEVVTMGNSLAKYDHSVTRGYISAITKQNGNPSESDRNDEALERNDVFMHDASIVGGNSGGVLANLDGEVIGITTYGEHDQYGTFRDFSLRINQVKPIIENLDLFIDVHKGITSIIEQRENDDVDLRVPLHEAVDQVLRTCEALLAEDPAMATVMQHSTTQFLFLRLIRKSHKNKEKYIERYNSMFSSNIRFTRTMRERANEQSDNA